MIKFKAQYENSVLNLPGKVSIHKHNVNQYEKVMKEKYADMIEEFQDNTEGEHLLSGAKPDKELKSTPSESNE